MAPGLWVSQPPKANQTGTWHLDDLKSRDNYLPLALRVLPLSSQNRLA